MPGTEGTVTNEQVHEALLRLLNGSAGAALPENVKAIITDSARYRRKLRELKVELGEIRKKVPKDGAVVLEGDDAKAWGEFKELKLTPTQVREAMKTAETTAAQSAETARKTAVEEAAALMGFTKPALLEDLASRQGVKGFTIEVRDGPAGTDGKATRVAYVRPHGDDGKPKAGDALEFGEFASKNLSDYAPALTAPVSGTGGAPAASGGKGATGAPASTGGTGTAGAPGARPVNPFPRQGTGGAPAKDNPVAKFKEAREAARKAVPDPLAPVKVATA
jgi:hypothetical protein